MLIALAAAAVAGVLLALAVYALGQRLSPDGKVYLQAGAGQRVPRPFHMRPALPWFCEERVRKWQDASVIGLVLAAVCIALLAVAQGVGPVRAVFAAGLFAALPIARTTASLPVLVDGPALGLTALSALLAVTGYGIEAAIVATAGAAVKEHVPVFAAAAAWSVWPLVGLIVPLALALTVTPAPAQHPGQAHPFAYAREKQAPRVLSALAMLLPWGACLFAVSAFSWPLAVSLLLAYGMLIVASDSTRVYQWAAIPVCVAAASAIPEAWLVPVALAHVFNPWQGDV